MTGKLSGIIPPVLTPMDDDDRIDAGVLRKHVRYLIDAGVSGLWVNGSTGEFYALSPQQRAACVSACVEEAAGQVAVVAHVGAEATATVVEHARSALDAGATHLAVVAPYYADFTQDELLTHYRRISDAIDRQLVIYHLPQLTKVGLTQQSVLRLARDGIATAIKDSSNDMAGYRSLVHRLVEEGLDMDCFTGGGSVVDVGLFVGGAGAMPALANLAPRHCVALYEAATRRDWAAVQDLQRGLDRLIRAMRIDSRATTWTPTVVIYKYVLVKRGLLPSARVAPPLAPLTGAETLHLDEEAVPMLDDLEGRWER